MPSCLRQIVARGYTQLVGPRQMRGVVLTALLLAASSTTAQQPPEQTGAEPIFRGCKALVEGQTTNQELFALGNLCAGMVIGLASVGQYLSPPEWRFCSPANSNAAQLAQVVIKYREAHPEQTPPDLRKIILEAFHDAWPCKSDR